MFDLNLIKLDKCKLDKMLEVLKQKIFKVPHQLWKCLYNTL